MSDISAVHHIFKTEYDRHTMQASELTQEQYQRSHEQTEVMAQQMHRLSQEAARLNLRNSRDEVMLLAKECENMTNELDERARKNLELRSTFQHAESAVIALNNRCSLLKSEEASSFLRRQERLKRGRSISKSE